MPKYLIKLSNILNFLLKWKCCLFLVFTLFSQKFYSQYYYGKGTPYNISDGLPSNEINDIKKDDIGYVWIATDKGLSMYDGFNFINFNSKTHPTIFKDNRIKRIQKNGDNLYLFTNSDGLIKLQTTTLDFQKIYKTTPLSISFSGDTTAVLFESGRLEINIKNKNLHVLQFNVLADDNLIIQNGQIYLSLKKMGVLKFSLLNPKQRTLIPLIENLRAGTLSLSKKYNIIHYNGHFVRILKNDSLFLHPELKGLEQINFFEEDEFGNCMYIEKNRTLNINYLNEIFSHIFGADNNLEFRTICKVSDNCFLIGTNQGITRINKNPAFSKQIKDYTITKPETIIIRRSILENNNKLYFLNYPFIIEQDSLLRNLTDSIIPPSDGLIMQNQLFFATDGNGLKSINLNTKKITNHSCNVMRTNESFESISVISDTLILLTKDNKIVLYNPSNAKGRAYYLKEGTIVHVAKQGKKSNIIYLGTNHGVFRFLYSEPIGIKPINLFSESNFDIRDILLRETKNQMWLATSQGVIVMDINNLKILKSYTNEYQVSHQKVVKLLEDDNNYIWASTYSGLTVYNTTNNTIRFINKNHGIYNTEYNYKSGCKLKNGNLAFGGLNSHEIINPNSLSEFKYVTKFLISGVEVIENETKKILKKYVEGQKLSFNTGKETLKIYAGTLDHQYENGYKFEYCLDTLNWQKITSKNFILISNLSYGDYILRIRMFNPFGEIVQEKQIPLIANVPFYITTTFYVIIILLIIILSALFIKFIIRTIKIEAETKAKIAMDLHDESGTILTRLLMLTRREKFEDKEKEHLQNGLKEVLFNFRTYLNSISRTKLTLIDLFDELRDFTNSYCRQAGIDVEFINHYDKNVRINNELFKDLKLAIYEIVTNCIKHSNADKICLSFNAKGNNLDIVVTDTGNCDINNLERNKGNGIRNTKKRISRNKGTISYSNVEGANGLMIKIKIPI